MTNFYTPKFEYLYSPPFSLKPAYLSNPLKFEGCPIIWVPLHEENLGYLFLSGSSKNWIKISSKDSFGHISNAITCLLDSNPWTPLEDIFDFLNRLRGQILFTISNRRNQNTHSYFSPNTESQRSRKAPDEVVDIARRQKYRRGVYPAYDAFPDIFDFDGDIVDFTEMLNEETKSLLSALQCHKIHDPYRIISCITYGAIELLPYPYTKRYSTRNIDCELIWKNFVFKLKEKLPNARWVDHLYFYIARSTRGESISFNYSCSLICPGSRVFVPGVVQNKHYSTNIELVYLNSEGVFGSFLGLTKISNNLWIP